MKTSIILSVIYLSIMVAGITGEVKCVIKMINCDWNPVGKAEIIYTAATFTGLGAVVGYIEIKDKK